MMKMVRRAEDLARAQQQRKIGQVAEHLRQLLSDTAVEAEEARVLVTGRGLLKRWLLDPSLRFLSGDTK